MHLFLHHRDIRYQDNTTLIQQMKQEGSVCPIFIFPPEQIQPNKNKYFSHNLVQFMIECLLSYNQDLQHNFHSSLYSFKGNTLHILKTIHSLHTIQSIGFNIDYSPYAKKRDQEIIDWANSQHITIYNQEDHVLYSILDGSTFAKSTGKPYTIYTPFMKHCTNNLTVRDIDTTKTFSFAKYPILKKHPNYFPPSQFHTLYHHNPMNASKGGRSYALDILHHLKDFYTYDKQRNQLIYETTHLSAYINFNVVSIREIYHAIIKILGKKHGLIRELIWREFYIHILYYFPHVVGHSYRKEFDKIKWSKPNYKKYWKAWCQGKTGFPVVDAGMRQLNATGFCHNRSRMIVATFLTKMLHIDWRFGEQYFAQHLIDYNIASNNGGWQWSASTGTDSQPYFRMFHYGNQIKSYDPKGEYIKRWIPELKDVPVEHLIEWEIYSDQYPNISYPKPIVHYKQERLVTLNMFRSIIQQKHTKT
jgi:deoxyribodipyrimidine photo-lyase